MEAMPNWELIILQDDLMKSICGPEEVTAWYKSNNMSETDVAPKAISGTDRRDWKSPGGAREPERAINIKIRFCDCTFIYMCVLLTARTSSAGHKIAW